MDFTCTNTSVYYPKHFTVAPHDLEPPWSIVGKLWVTSEPIRARVEGAVAPVRDRRNEHGCAKAECLFHLSMLQSWRLIEVNHLLLVMSDSATLTPSLRSDPRLTAVLCQPATSSHSLITEHWKNMLWVFLGWGLKKSIITSLYCRHTRASKTPVAPVGKQLLSYLSELTCVLGERVMLWNYKWKNVCPLCISIFSQRH